MKEKRVKRRKEEGERKGRGVGRGKRKNEVEESDIGEREERKTLVGKV